MINDHGRIEAEDVYHHACQTAHFSVINDHGRIEAATTNRTLLSPKCFSVINDHGRIEAFKRPMAWAIVFAFP